MNYFLENGNDAFADYSEAVRLAPDDPAALNSLAWLLATHPDPNARDPNRAVQLANKAVNFEDLQAPYWNTLGAAQYRAGDWQAAIAALDKSMQLRQGGDSFDWFLLAIAH